MSSNTISVLRPGSGVDLVFELDSLDPKIKPSIIFEVDEKLKQVIVSQPTLKISPGFAYNKMHISSLVKTSSDKARYGFPCKIIKNIDNYTLSSQNQASAILIEYIDPPVEINIRSAFRLHPSPKFEVIGKLIYKGQSFYSGVHFKVFNISSTGLGILIPKKIKNVRNPLLNIEMGGKSEVGLLLKTNPAPGADAPEKKEAPEEEPKPFDAIKTAMKIVRVNTNFNEMSGFCGGEFSKLNREHEEILNRFIHNAQLHEIRKSTGM